MAATSAPLPVFTFAETDTLDVIEQEWFTKQTAFSRAYICLYSAEHARVLEALKTKRVEDFQVHCSPTLSGFWADIVACAAATQATKLRIVGNDEVVDGEDIGRLLAATPRVTSLTLERMVLAGDVGGIVAPNITELRLQVQDSETISRLVFTTPNVFLLQVPNAASDRITQAVQWVRTQLQHLYIVFSGDINTNHIEQLADLFESAPRLHTIDLKSATIEGDDLLDLAQVVADAPTITTFRLQVLTVKSPPHCTKERRLFSPTSTLKTIFLTARELAQVSACDVLLRSVAKIEGLEGLEWAVHMECPYPAWLDIETLACASTLRALWVVSPNATPIPGRSIMKIAAKCTNLEKLSLYGKFVVDQGFSIEAPLRVLRLQAPTSFGDEVGKFVVALKHPERLEQLMLSTIPEDPSAFHDHLSRATNLHTLNVILDVGNEISFARLPALNDLFLQVSGEDCDVPATVRNILSSLTLTSVHLSLPPETTVDPDVTDMIVTALHDGRIKHFCCSNVDEQTTRALRRATSVATCR